ncbi:MAG: hypothetical protein AAFO29_02695 [Actinomycetota bacterium]
MMDILTTQAHATASEVSRPRTASMVQLGAYQAVSTGENRLGFGEQAINGFAVTGCDAHAAVRMHAAPATDTPWSTDRKGKSMAPTPSAGMLRRS